MAVHSRLYAATLLDDIQGLLGQKALGRSRCTSQTAFRHFGLEDSAAFFRTVIVGIVSSPKLSLTSLLYSWERFRPGGGEHPAEVG